MDSLTGLTSAPLAEFVPVSVRPPAPNDLVDAIVVETEEQLRRLIKKLLVVDSFAVDVEHHSERSYWGMTCLVQISTRDDDYLVDPFPLWAHMHLLNAVMTNARILKVLGACDSHARTNTQVFHGANSDILWLQRDFGVYVVNMFDTYRAMKALQYKKLSLYYLVKSVCDVDLNKEMALADWRQR
jgi:exosome complex exonuclease RRP6